MEYTKVSAKRLVKYGNIITEEVNGKTVKSLYLKEGIVCKNIPDCVDNELYMKAVKNKSN